MERAGPSHGFLKEQELDQETLRPCSFDPDPVLTKEKNLLWKKALMDKGEFSGGASLAFPLQTTPEMIPNKVRAHLRYTG